MQKVESDSTEIAPNVILTKVGIQCLEKKKVAGFRVRHGMPGEASRCLASLKALVR